MIVVVGEFVFSVVLFVEIGVKVVIGKFVVL